MSYRELKITLDEDGSVICLFRRYGFAWGVLEYLVMRLLRIILPFGKRNITSLGCMRLTWRKHSENPTLGDGRILAFESRGRMRPLSEAPPLWKYSQRIRIKGSRNDHYRLRLQGHNRRVSAVKASSSAVFRSYSRGHIHCCGALLRNGSYECTEHRVRPGSTVQLRPTELADARFHCYGVLRIKWTLEIDESVS